MKKIFLTLLTITLVFAVNIPALAGNVNFSHKFTDTTTTVTLATGTKNDSDQYWFIKITSGPSSKNIFGGRPKVGGTSASSYYIWNYTFSKSKQYGYTPNLVTKKSKVGFNGKKDDSSTSSNDLTVVGTFCP